MLHILSVFLINFNYFDNKFMVFLCCVEVRNSLFMRFHFGYIFEGQINILVEFDHPFNLYEYKDSNHQN